MDVIKTKNLISLVNEMKPYLYSDSVSPFVSPTHTLAQNLHLVDSSDAWRANGEEWQMIVLCALCCMIEH